MKGNGEHTESDLKSRPTAGVGPGKEKRRSGGPIYSSSYFIQNKSGIIRHCLPTDDFPLAPVFRKKTLIIRPLLNTGAMCDTLYIALSTRHLNDG